MLVVVASLHDSTARELVSRWSAYEAGLLTSADLSVAGWRHYIGAPGASTAVVGGRVVNVADITGILSRLPWVFEAELPHIVLDDRSYVATEMSAFLLSWLSSLTCAVINRPHPGCLVGPAWRTAKWLHLVSQIGVPVSAQQQQIKVSIGSPSRPFATDAVAVTVVGDCCFGSRDTTLKNYARRISKAADVDLLTVYFSEESAKARFLGVQLCPEILSDEIADAILERLAGGCTC
jgi:hypothetical protein